MVFSRTWLYLIIGLNLLLCSEAFKNPIKLQNGSDPQIVYWDGYYYLTSTTWTNIQVTRATTIAGLKTASPVTVWTDSNSARCCNVWAPEMHRIDGRWYIYYTAGPSGSDYSNAQKTWVIQGGDYPSQQSYTFLGQMISPNNNVANLDPSVISIGGKNYYIYSVWTSGQSIFIAELLTPSTIGPSTKISSPEYQWERNKWSVNEGPYGLTSPSGQSFIFFSGSSCETSYYALGYIALTPGANPLSASSWKKNPNAVFSSANGAYGPGHNGFFKSPDGTEDWIVYHANSNSNGVCDGNRSTRVQKISWNADGTPNLGAPLNTDTEIQEPSSNSTIRK